MFRPPEPLRKEEHIPVPIPFFGMLHRRPTPPPQAPDTTDSHHAPDRLHVGPSLVEVVRPGHLRRHALTRSAGAAGLGARGELELLAAAMAQPMVPAGAGITRPARTQRKPGPYGDEGR